MWGNHGNISLELFRMTSVKSDSSKTRATSLHAMFLNGGITLQ